ncbi:MAG: hypothetical protein AAB316_11675, partial [Bacteroidota bacterium]
MQALRFPILFALCGLTFFFQSCSDSKNSSSDTTSPNAVEASDELAAATGTIPEMSATTKPATVTRGSANKSRQLNPGGNLNHEDRRRRTSIPRQISALQNGGGGSK